MAFPTVASAASGVSPSPRRYSSETEGGGYRTGDAVIGEIVFTALLDGAEPLPGWTVDSDRRWMYRMVTESGPQPWPGFEFRATYGGPADQTP